MYWLEGRCRDEDVEMAVQLEAEAKSCRLKLFSAGNILYS
jgi:hypothetical protein